MHIWGTACLECTKPQAYNVTYAPVSGMPHYPYMGLMWGKVGICTR